MKYIEYDTIQCHVEEVLRMSDSYTAVVCGVYVLCAALSKAAELLASRQRKHTPLMRRALLNSASNLFLRFIFRDERTAVGIGLRSIRMRLRA